MDNRSASERWGGNGCWKLFQSESLPRKPSIKRMHVYDAGIDVIQFLCGHCGHLTDWQVDTHTVAENKRGLPCPKCNEAKP